MREAAGGLEAAYLEVTVVLAPPGSTDVFARGDANSDGTINLTDGIQILNFLFGGTGAPACVDAADIDDDGTVILTDAIRLINWLFRGDAAPSPPTPSTGSYLKVDCGPDPTQDTLNCESFAQSCMP